MRLISSTSCASRIPGTAARNSDGGQQTTGRVQFAVYKCRVQDQFRLLVADLRLSPAFDLPLHRFKISLDAVNAHCQSVDQVEALAVLRQYRGKVAAEGHVRAHKYAYADRQTEAERFVVRIADAD